MPTENPRNPTPDELNEELLTVSKSQLKREAQEKTSLASELLEFSAAQLRALPLEPDVLLAVEQARSIRSHGARKRQLLYVAKLLRRMDQAELMAAVSEFQATARGLSVAQHRVEAWRTVLLDRGDTALAVLLKLRNVPDAQALRLLIRKARQEIQAGKPPAAARALFRALRSLDAAEPLPPVKQVLDS